MGCDIGGGATGCGDISCMFTVLGLIWLVAATVRLVARAVRGDPEAAPPTEARQKTKYYNKDGPYWR